MTYGFIRDVEYELFDELLLTIKQEFGAVRFLEVGVFGAVTAAGVVNRCAEIGCPVYCAGVDIMPLHGPGPLPDYAYYQEDSMDAWRKVTGTFNLLFIDGCHCVVHSTCDFLNYSPFVEVGGYCLFHDTALREGQSTQDQFPQDHSYAGNPPSVLGVREGLTKLGLLQGHRRDWEFVRELPAADGQGGMCLFKKVAAL